VTAAQRVRLFGLLRSAGDVWACVLERNRFRSCGKLSPVVTYHGLCHMLTEAGPGTFGELGAAGARSVLRRYSDAWFAAAARRKNGDMSARFPRRKRALMPVRWYHSTFQLDGRRLKLPVAKGCPPLIVRLDRDVPYPMEQVRSVTLLYDGERLQIGVTAEVPVAVYRDGEEPDLGRVAGVDLGVIHPYAVAGPDGEGLLVSGRAIRAEHRQHLRDLKARGRTAARRAPRPGQRGSRRWRQHRRHQRKAQNRHVRRVQQAGHEAARQVITWAIRHRVGTLVVGDPRGVLDRDCGRVHNKRVRDWAPGRAIAVLEDKAAAAGITVTLVCERGTSSTCPACSRRVPKPPGRVFCCPYCGQSGHRDLVAAASIAARAGGGNTIARPAVVPVRVEHRRAGTHLPGVHPARRDPRRRLSSRPAPWGPAAGTGPPRSAGSRSPNQREARKDNGQTPDMSLRTGARYMMLLTPAQYVQLPAVRADLLAKLGRTDEARNEFTQAAALTRNERERAVFQTRAAECATQ
jgi:transposase